MDSNSGKGGKKGPATKKLDFYELLEIDRSATPEQVKSTYKKLALVSFFMPLNISVEMASG